MTAQSAENKAIHISNRELWLGRVVSTLPVLFLILDAALKLAKPAPVIQANLQLGYPERLVTASEFWNFCALFCTRSRGLRVSEQHC